MAGDRKISITNGNYNERIEGDYIQGNVYNTADLSKQQKQPVERGNSDYSLKQEEIDNNSSDCEVSMKDVFICHASEDKPSVVEPLVAALKQADISY